MFIQTEETPNPQTLKFIPGITVMKSGSASFSKREDATNSPLAQALFAIEEVKGVYLGSDFITITKSPEVEWNILKPAILTTIMDHFVSGKEVITSDAKKVESASSSDDDEITKQIRELIETRVRPAVAMDGGDIIFRGFHDGIVQLELHGSCSGCPSSTITLKQGIENMLKHYVPEVKEVEAVM